MLKDLGMVDQEYRMTEHTDTAHSVNHTMNAILKLHPRVTHPSEYIALATLAAATRHNILEVGCYLGYSTCIMASALSGNRKIFAVDMFDREKGWKHNTSDDWIFKNYSQLEWAQKTVAELGFTDRVEFIKSTSADYAEKLNALPKKEKYDLIFIDGDHSYEGCMQDLALYAPLLEPGGFIAAHDYISPKYPGVKKAVDAFILQNSAFEALYIIQSMILVRKNRES